MRLSSDNNRVFLIQTIASASSQLDSLTGLARKYVTNKFPKHYFRHVYVDTGRTISERNKNDSYNQNAQKIPYPSLTESVEISLDDTFNVKNWHITDVYLGLRKPIDKNYVCIYRDQENRMQLYATCEYITSKFRFKIATDSYIANVDLANYINSRFRRDFFQYLPHQVIETEIPKTMMKIIADTNHLNLENAADMDKMSQIIAATSRTPRMIRKKVNNATGQVSYFLADDREILTVFTDLDVPAQIIRSDMAEGEYVIEFTIQMSAWQINNFILSVRRDLYMNSDFKKYFAKDCVIDNGEIVLSDDTIKDAMVIPMEDSKIPVLQGKMCNFRDGFGNEQIGSMICNALYTRPVNAPPLEAIHILDSLPKEYKDHIPYYQKNLSTKAMTQLLYVRLLTNDGVLEEGVDYTVDYYNLDITMHHNSDSEIRILVYINRLFYELLADCEKNGTEYTNLSKLGTWDINPFGTYKIRALLKSVSKTYKPEQCLRVMTERGVGYVVLDEPTDSRVAARVCVGYDKNNKPIIKEMKEV